MTVAGVGVRAGGRSRWAWSRTLLTSVTAVIVGAGVLVAPAPAFADETRVEDLRRWAVDWVKTGDSSVAQAAEAAVIGSDADVRAFHAQGLAVAQEQDDRVRVEQYLSMGGAALEDAAQAALDGSATDRRKFLRSGWLEPWAQDERTRLAQTMSLGGPEVRKAAQAALNAGDDAIADFLSDGQFEARSFDDRTRIAQLMSTGGDELRTAARAALNGSPEDMREFLAHGQHVARARDDELSTVSELAALAKEAGELAAVETQAAKDAAGRAVQAAAAAKAAAQRAAAETEAARDSALKASAAAGRAADAASRAAKAAQAAIGAAKAAAAAARVASHAASRAANAAAMAENAAARARTAAAAAATNAGSAKDAKDAAKAARDVAAGAQKAGDAAKAAGDAVKASVTAALAASGAVADAEAAATAAEQAAGMSGVAASEAAKARRAASQARAKAREARRAANSAMALAQKAADAAEDARRYAHDSAKHAIAAADAADDAAAHAGEGKDWADRAAAHAAAAMTAARTAATVVSQAEKAEESARNADAERLTSATAEAVFEAAREREVEQDRLAKAAWDAEERARRDAETTAWLAQAQAPGAVRDVVVSNGRRVAARLLIAGDSWTRTAAEQALIGSDADVVEYVARGVEMAAQQDDRAKVGFIADSAPKPELKAAAEKAMFAPAETMREFLRSRWYEGKEFDDRTEIARLMSIGGDKMKEEGRKALSGTNADRQEFLSRGQFAAAEFDDRQSVAKVMSTGGPEIDAAAQIALSGPRASIRHFLTVTQFKAAQRDGEAAAHAKKIRTLILSAGQNAAKALKDAADAAKAAALARGKQAEAEEYARQASASAEDAQGYADQAAVSANEATQSAQRAAASAKQANDAANAAERSANEADRHAKSAEASAYRAKVAADEAQESARKAKSSAEAAGKDAAEAAKFAAEAIQISIMKQNEEAEARRKANQADPTALPECNLAYKMHGIHCKGGELLDAIDKDRNWCTIQFGDTKACETVIQYYDEKTAHENEQAKVVLQLVLAVCGFVPVVGEPCDAMDALIAYLDGDKTGAGLSLLAMIPGAGSIFGGARSADLIRQLKKFKKKAEKCPVPNNSFVPGTPVLMEDRSTKPIEKIQIGDRVLATDPIVQRTAAKPVVALIVGAGLKRLVDVQVDVDGDRGDATETVTATADHRFWTPTLDTWVEAANLRTGQLLRTPDHGEVRIAGVRGYTRRAKVYNFSVATIHTYYVGAGATPVLVHNEGCWEVSDDVLDDIYDNFDAAVYQGVEYNMRRYNEGATGHALNGVGMDPRRMAEYFARNHNYAYRDINNPNVSIAYDSTNKILVIRDAKMIHAYNYTQDAWDKNKGVRYLER